jgi:hypothetical protein
VYPRLKAAPSTEKSPVSDSEMPTVTGVLLVPPPPLPLLWPLPHAASAVAAAAAAARARNRVP